MFPGVRVCERRGNRSPAARPLLGCSASSGPGAGGRHGPAETFPRAASFRRYTGLTPSASETGESDAKGRATSKAGVNWLRRQLVQSTNTARQVDPELGRIYFVQKVERGAHHNKASCVVPAGEFPAIGWARVLRSSDSAARWRLRTSVPSLPALLPTADPDRRWGCPGWASAWFRPDLLDPKSASLLCGLFERSRSGGLSTQGPSALASRRAWVDSGSMVEFRDRVDAGRELAEELKRRVGGEDVVVLGLPRGGVPVAFEVARELDAPLDVIVVRKLGVPYQPELGMGAIGEDGVRILNREVLAMARVGEDEVAAVERSERAELERRAIRFRGSRPRTPLAGRTAVVVDDGIATGATARAACQVARAHGASRVVLAVPVAPWSSLGLLAEVADEVVCLATPEPFYAVGQFYRDFSQTSDEEVVGLLKRAATRTPAPPVAVSADPPIRDEDVVVEIGAVRLVGHLTIPEECAGLVVFAHGSGSSRHSPRNRFVAAVLNSAGLGTLLFDLLTPDEEFNRAAVFDIGLLAERLGVGTRWLEAQPEAKGLRIGYFGASTGAGAALWAAAEPDSSIAAVVSRGGRPDLAGSRLDQVRAATLLIVGGRDEVVLELNRQAQMQLRCQSQLEVVAGATHLFEEPGALEEVSRLAGDWFLSHLAPSAETVG